MSKQILGAILLASIVTGAWAEPIARQSFDKPGAERYNGVAYHWLDKAPLSLKVEASKDLALDLLWGSKNDTRSAEVVINGKAQTFKAGKYDGFQWQRVPLPDSKGETLEIIIKPAPPKAAFIAELRVVKASDPLPKQPPVKKASQPAPENNEDHDLYKWKDQLAAGGLDVWERARIHGLQSNEALRRCRKYVDGWLANADPKSGLIPRNLKSSRNLWNGRDSAADNYAFMVLTCALTDRGLFDGRMIEMLEAEQRLTNRVGALPDHFNFDKQDFHHDEADMSRLMFDGSEYVKDGLMPITEWLGHTPWSVRMIAIVDSILEQASHDTPAGPIPSDNVEVNGEMMQVLSRLAFMAKDERYLDMACRIADYYLLGDRHPTRDATSLKLRDHGCELISGLTEVYAACHFSHKDKVADYREPIHAMLDRILEVGVNEHGMMFDAVNPKTGAVTKNRIGDNWGYNYNGFYTVWLLDGVYLLDGVERYRDATRHAMASLKPHYYRFAWQGWGSDGIADSVEGAINLFNRESDVEGVAEWIDENIARMLLLQQDDGIIEGWHGDGNYARTAIMWALWKQQGVTIQPWREDVKLGATRDGDELRLVIASKRPWKGRLIFDTPRHKTVMRLPIDYPRINQFPEWFTAEDEADYEITSVGKVNGKALRNGIEIELGSDEERRLVLTRRLP